MSETELYNFLQTKLDAIGIERLMSQLRYDRTALVDFTTDSGRKARLEITAV